MANVVTHSIKPGGADVVVPGVSVPAKRHLAHKRAAGWDFDECTPANLDLQTDVGKLLTVSKYHEQAFGHEAVLRHELLANADLVRRDIGDFNRRFISERRRVDAESYVNVSGGAACNGF